MSENKKGTVMCEVRDLPKLDKMNGVPKRNVTPMDQFYHDILRLYVIHGGLVNIDIKKVTISPDDAVGLFRQYRSYLKRKHTDLVDKDLKEAWEAIRPTIHAGVPQGKVYLQPGYFFMRKEISNERQPYEEVH